MHPFIQFFSSLSGIFFLCFFSLLLVLLVFWREKNKWQAQTAVLSQQNIQSQTALDGLQIRLQERDEHLKQYQQKINEQYNQLKHLNGYVASLNGQCSLEHGKVESLMDQLSEKQAYIEQKQQKIQLLQNENTRLQSQISEFKTILEEKTASFHEQQQNFEASRAQLKIEFQNLANRILDEKAQVFRQQNQSAITDLLKPFREQIHGFQQRVNEIHSESLKGQAGIEVEIKKMLELGLNMSQEANNLTSALKGNKKSLGNWGEMQLEQTLQMAGLEPNVHYTAQAHFTAEDGKKQYPDFVLSLPDEKHMVIDSKMSLVAYEKAVSAENDTLRQAFLNEHCQALRHHIDDLARKNYSSLKGLNSPNFVLMFVALEPAYIEALRNDPNLFDYGYQKNIILVSHTTLMPILRTVTNLWRLDKGNKEALEISQHAGELYNQLCTVVERLKRLGNALNTANTQYNETVVAFAGKQGIIGKAERFQKLSSKANKEMPELESVQQENDKMHLLG